MAECKECLYYEVCADFRRNICKTDQKRFEEYKINSNGICDNFKSKAEYKQIKHGTWYHGTENGVVYAKCSACGRRMNYSCYGYAYCALCGARMDGTPKERGGEK